LSGGIVCPEKQDKGAGRSQTAKPERSGNFVDKDVISAYKVLSVPERAFQYFQC
jgi:hypothetical protein